MKLQGIDTEQTQSANINWGQILGKGANGARSLFEPIMPTTIGTLSATTDILKDVRNATRALRSTSRRQDSQMKNSAANKKSQKLFASAFNDIESGSFSMNKINDDLFDDYESQSASSFNIPTGDDVVEMSSEEILLLGNRGIAQSVIQSSSAQLRGLETSSKALINANIKSTQALGISLNNTLSYGFNTLNTSLTIQNQKLTKINHSIDGLLEFNNKNALEYYSKSIDVMAGLGKSMDNFEKTLNPDSRKKARAFDVSYGLDPKKYIEYIKQGFQETLLGSTASSTSTSGEGAKDFGIMGIVADLLVPTALKKPMEKVDKSITRMLDESFKRLGERLNENEWLNLFGIGDIFGSKRESLKKVNMGAYLKDATPWNGMAQKALIEVIPELLTSIDSKLDNSEKRYYDYSSGQFRDKSEIERSYQNQYFDTLSTSLKSAMDKLDDAIDSTGRRATPEHSELITKLDALIDDQFTGKKDTMYVRNNMNTLLRDFGIDESHIREFIQEYQDGLEQGISRWNDVTHEIESTQHIYRTINNTKGSEASGNINKKHGIHITDADNISRYQRYSFMGGKDPTTYIKNLLTDLKIDESDPIATDRDFIESLLYQKAAGINDNELKKQIKKEIGQRHLSEKASEKFGIFDKIRQGAEWLGNQIDRRSDRPLNWAYNKIYNSGTIQDNSESSSQTPGVESVGYGNINPASVAKYAASNGYISQGGANTNLFTDGAARLGLSGTPITNSKSLKSNLLAGKPVILSGKSSSTSDPYTKAGHIVMADGISGNRMNVLDPITGRRKMYNVNNVSDKTENAWGYTAGYGPGATSRATNKGHQLSSKETDAVNQLTDLGQQGYDKSMNLSQSELERNHANMMRGIRTLNESEAPESIEESIMKSNNMMQASIGALLSGFMNFTSRLFGKEGFFKKIWDSETRKKITGRLFTDDNAIFKKQYDGVKAGLVSLKDKTLGYIGKGYDFLYDNTMKSKYGEDYEEKSEEWKANKFISETLNRKWRAEQREKNAEEVKRDQIDVLKTPSESETDITTDYTDAVIDATKSAEDLKDHTEAITEVVVGDTKKSPEQKKRAFGGEFMKRLKDTAPKALAAGIAGAGIGLLNNQFSLLGSMFLPGGPVAGAIVGSGLTILTQTEAFKTLMFGKLSNPDDPNSAREGGLISNELKAKFMKMMPFAIGGAVTGGLGAILKGALGFNSGLGVLGMQILPGGILGGALLGAGLGILKNSDRVQEMLFGKKDADGNRQGKFLSNMANKSKDLFSTMIPRFKKGAAGLGVGALAGAVLQNSGYIPAMLSMGGPVGMGIVGLGLGIASSTEKFNEWMFGTKDPDTGERRKDGVLSRSVNMLRLNVIEPIGDAFKTKMLDLVDWTRDKITYPFRLAFGPIIDSLTGIKDNVVEFVKDKFEALGNGIMDLMSKTMKSLFSPVTKLIGFVGKSIIGIASTGTKIALSPISLGLQAMEFLTMGKRRKEYVKFAKEYYAGGGMTGALNEKWDNDAKEGKARNFFGKMSDTVGAFLGQGEASAIAKNKYADRRSEEGDNSVNWMRVSRIGTERNGRRKAIKQRREDEKRWAAINKERKKIMTEFGGREVTLSDKAVSDYQKKFGNLGISKKYLQSSNDIMDLVYRRDEFKERMNPVTEGGSVFEETAQQKQARENTEKFRENILTSMKQLLSVFGADKPGTETVAETLNDIKQSSEETAATNNLQAEISTGGEANETIKPKRGQNLKASIVKKYNAVASFLGFKKKQEAVDKEKDETEEASEGTDALESKSAIKEDDTPKEQSMFGKLWSKIKSVGAIIGGTTIGSFLLKGAKFAGVVGLLGGLGFTIAELIRPGTAENIGAKIDAFNESVKNGDFTFDNVINDVKEKMCEFGTTILNGAKNIVGDENVDSVKKFILESIPEYATKTGDFLRENSGKVVTALSSVIENLAPPLIEAFVQTIPTIAWAAIRGIASGTVKIIGSGVDAVFDKLGIGSPKSDTVSESTAITSFENEGTRFKANVMTSKTVTSDIQAMSRLNSKDASVRNTVIQNAVSGQYYIYDDTTQTQKRNYLSDDAAMTMLSDSEMASNIWYDPCTDAYFVEEATYEQYADNVYVTASGNMKKQGHTDITRSIVKESVRASTRVANGLSAFSKGDKFILKGVTTAGKTAGKLMSKLGSAMSKLGGGIGKLIGGSTKITGDITSTVSDTAAKQMPKLLEKVRKMLSSIKGNKTLLKVFDKFKRVLTISADDVLINLVKYLDDIAVKSFGKAKGVVAEKIAASATRLIGKSAVTSLPLITIVSATWGLVDGALSASNLFEVPQEDVDWKMTLISALMEALLSISVGCIIDLLFDIVDFASGKDLKHEIAIFLYKLISGYDADAIEKLSNSSENLALETSIYNAFNNTNLSTKSYNDKQNKDLIGKIGSAFKSFGNWVTGNSDKNYIDSGKAYSDYSKILKEAGYTDSEISKMSKEQISSAVRSNVDSSSLSTNSKQKVRSSLGYGLGYSVKSSSPYAQGNPKWANMPIGKLPNGSVATMSNAGCGPTALAAVANTVAQRSIGYGPITPADMGAYAVSNGYISQGGANAGLFTEGANNLGLRSTVVKNPKDLKNNLLAGRPTVLTGKSTNSNDPYTKSGHIVVADGMIGDKMCIMDPITGKRKLYNAKDVSKKTEHAWAYSAGYGPSIPRVEDDGGSSSSKTTLPQKIPDSAVITAFGTSSTTINGKQYILTKSNSDYIHVPAVTANGFTITPGYWQLKTSNTTSTTENKFTSSGGRDNDVTTKNNQSTRTSFGTSTENEFTSSGGRDENSAYWSTVNTDTDSSNNDIIIDEINTGITSADQLKEYAASKGIFGKLSLMGKVLQAKMNSLLFGTSFWEEFGKLTTDTTESAVLTGSSTTLKQMSEHPNNVKEELLAKTIERVYIGESGGNYAEVINDSNNKASVGPYQANGQNASNLLTDLSNATGLPYELKNIFTKYAQHISAGKSLSADQRSELSNALSNSEYKDIIMKTIDTNAMNYYYKTFYKPYATKYYDGGIIKDLRTLPMLADIGNTGYDFITNSSNTRKNSFMYNWTPVNKDKEFKAAHDLLTSSKMYYKNSKYSKGYLNRINNTYDALKDYTFKHSIAKGEMTSAFASPVGFGPLDAASGFSSTINSIGDSLIDQFGKLTGIEPSLFGLTKSTDTMNTYDEADSYSYNGSYSNQGQQQLINISGTDRDRFLAAAKSQVGYVEKANATDLKSFSNKYNNTNTSSNSGYTKYGKEIGSNPNPWCAYFTSWAAKAAGIPTEIIHRAAGCTRIMEDAIDDKTLRYRDEYIGKPGDLVLFNEAVNGKWKPIDNPRKAKKSSHIGIVTSANSDTVNTIEGNTSIGNGYHGVGEKQRSLSDKTIIGFIRPPWTNETKTVNPSNMLKLGYGNPNITKIDSPAYREQMRESIKEYDEFKVTPKDFEAIGFGPGMTVDAGFDMTNTDSKLDKIFSVIAEWYTESKKTGAAQSSSTNNINMVKANTTNVSSNPTSTPNVNVQKYKESIINNHVILASKANIRNHM